MLQCLFAIKHSKKDTSSSQCLWAGQGLSHIMPLTPFPYIWVKELPPLGIKWTLLPLCPNGGLIKLDVICWWAYLHQSKVKQWREGTVSFAHRRRLKQLEPGKKQTSLNNSLHSHFRLSHRKRSSEAKRLWACSGFSCGCCCERVCVACVLLRERERDREKVGQGKRRG